MEFLISGPSDRAGVSAGEGVLIPLPEPAADGAALEPEPPRRHSSAALRHRLALTDTVALVLAWSPQTFLLAGWGHVRGPVSAFLAGLVAMGMLRVFGTYRSRVCARKSSEALRVAAVGGAGGATILILAWFAGIHGAWLPALEGGVTTSVAVLVLRWHFGRWLKERRSVGDYVRPVVLVGTSDDAVDLWTMLVSEPDLGYQVVAVVGEDLADRPWASLPSGRNAAELADVARRAGACGILVVGTALTCATIRDMVRHATLAGLHVQLWPGLPNVGRRLRSTPLSGEAMLYIEPHRVVPWQAFVKRMLDLVVASVALVLALPVLGLVAVAIKLDDGGAILYRGQRVGRFGKLITVFKLRTMAPGTAQMTVDLANLNERTDGPLFKASFDPRVTRIGRLLRATSIDELPQLWNVLNGTMSIVGPRPALTSETEQFDDELQRRLQVRPGITGLWQIEARDNPSFNAYRRLDLAYLDNWSVTLDVVIMLTTVHAVVTRAVRVLIHVGRPVRPGNPLAETINTNQLVAHAAAVDPEPTPFVEA